MARQPKPWFRKDRKIWYVTINGKRHNLGPHKKEAFASFYELMRGCETQRVKTTSCSLVQIIDEFLDWVSRNRSAATYEWYRSRLQNFIDVCGEIDLLALKPHHVEKWASNPDHSTTTRRNQMRSIKRCLKWAVAHGYLSTNPIEYLEVPSSTPKDTYVKPDEFEYLMQFVTEGNFADLVRITYETGCRPQEIIRIESRHADLSNSRWVIPASEAKVKSSPRIIYLSEHAITASKVGINSWTTGPIFRNLNGKPWNKDSIGCQFARLQIRMAKAMMKQQGKTISERDIINFIPSLNQHRTSHGQTIPKTAAELREEAKRKLTERCARQIAPRYSLYALRHSWATNALKRGVDPLTVAILMGHKDPSTLARTYQHLSHNPEHMLAQAQKAVG